MSKFEVQAIEKSDSKSSVSSMPVVVVGDVVGQLGLASLLPPLPPPLPGILRGTSKARVLRHVALRRRSLPPCA